MFLRLRCSSHNGCLLETISARFWEVKKEFGYPNLLLTLFNDKNVRLRIILSCTFLSELEQDGPGTDKQGAHNPVEAKGLLENEIGNDQAE